MGGNKTWFKRLRSAIQKLFVLSAVLYMDLDKTIDMWHEICQQQKKLVTSEHKKTLPAFL